MSKHYTIKGLVLLSLVICATAYANTANVERVIWQKKPIIFTLAVGKERLAHFPAEVRYWIPSSLEDSISILSANGVVYITPHKAFEKTRIRVQNVVTQKIYLLDLVASENEAVTSELIVTDAEYIENKSEDYEKPFDWPVRLTRFAAQYHYAEERLLPSDNEIKEVRIDTKTPLPLVRGGDIEAIPVKSWRGGGYYITAMRIRNLMSNDIAIVHTASNTVRSLQRTIILATDIRGQWVAVTPQHTNVGAAGREDDITTLYLISEQSFKESF